MEYTFNSYKNSSSGLTVITGKAMMIDHRSFWDRILNRRPIRQVKINEIPTWIKGTVTAESHSNWLSMLIPAMGSVSVSILSRFRSHRTPDMAQDTLTMVNKHTAGARSSFKYFNSFRNSAISWNFQNMKRLWTFSSLKKTIIGIISCYREKERVYFIFY